MNITIGENNETKRHVAGSVDVVGVHAGARRRLLHPGRTGLCEKSDLGGARLSGTHRLPQQGLENAGAWSVAAGFMHLIPYFGPVLTAGAVGMAAYMQFNSAWMVFLVSGAYLIIATIIGIFVTTWMTGRIAKMNPAAVFISLLFFAWLWGVWGMLLGIPIIVIMKVICEHIEQLQPVAEMLSD